MIAATGAPHTVIHREEVAETVAARRGRPLVLVDVALPRDVEERVDGLPGVFRYDIDDLRARLDENLAQREATRPSVEALVDAELAAWTAWYNSRQAVPTLVKMRSKVQAIAESELAETLAQLPDLDARESEAMRRMVHRLVNKVLHEPTVHLKAAAAQSSEEGEAYADAIRALFNLSAEADEWIDESAGPKPSSVTLFESPLVAVSA